MGLILGIDAGNWICSLWHAQGGRGVLDSARRRIDALSAKLRPSHVIACFDRRSFRHDLYAAYKAGRKAKPEGLQRDLDEGPAALATAAVPCAVDGFEADDLLATLAAIGGSIATKVVIASPDKDLHQVLRERQVTILKKFTLHGDRADDCEWFTADDLFIRTGLEPPQWPDYQALVGDSTDGIPGCAGWGEKTTLPALLAAGSLERMFADPWKLPITAKQQAGLLAFRKQAETMLALVRLRSDVTEVWDAMR